MYCTIILIILLIMQSECYNVFSAYFPNCYKQSSQLIHKTKKLLKMDKK